MSIGLDRFRAGDGDRFVVTRDASGNATGIAKAELKFNDRFVAWKNNTGTFSDGNAVHQQQNREFKQAFYQALVKSSGQELADRAVSLAGLPANWRTTGSALSGKRIKAVLNHAKEFHRSAVNRTEANVREFLKSTGPNTLTGVFLTAGPNNKLKAEDLRNPQLIALFRREVKRDPNYGKAALLPSYLARVAQRAIQKFAQQRTNAFREQYPGLASFVQNGQTPGLHEDARWIFAELKAKLDPNTANGSPIAGEPQAFRDGAEDALDAIASVHDMLRQMRFDPQGWQALGDQLFNKYDELNTLEQRLTGLAPNDVPQSAEGGRMLQDLVAELRNQKNLLLSKAGFLDDVRESDPLSQKWVAYSDMMWAHAVEHQVSKAVEHLQTHGDPDTTAASIRHILNSSQNFLNQKTADFNAAPRDQRTILPRLVKKQDHPVFLGGKAAQAFLKQTLTAAGMDPAVVETLTSPAAMKGARQRALNQNQAWANVNRDIVVSRGGVTRTYRSTIIPAANINPRFARRLQGNAPLDQVNQPHEGQAGVSAMTKADHYHARNLKVSKLQRVGPNGNLEDMGTVVGHGVLDMWDIADPVERARANERGAKEALEAAIATNDRVRHEALARAANGNPNAVKLVHVSVNLTTPAGWRELPGLKDTKPLHDYQEQTYTREQFRAFQANTSAGQGRTSVEFQVDDDRPHGANLGQDARINVDVDVISFSFGINPLATGKVPDWVGGWASVYEHNKSMMEKFVGDLGTGKFGATGAEPGGFIGSVYDRLSENVPAQAELRAKIREQTDLVRTMFTTEAFKKGNGDPAKMSRHILYLQGLAEQALGELQVNDLAATMSKGCKSDKDRGGIVDGELKHMLMTEDMGGEVLPDGRLEGDDQMNYYNTQSAFGGLEVQLANTAGPGSKEANKMGDKIPDRVVRDLLSGIGGPMDD